MTDARYAARRAKPLWGMGIVVLFGLAPAVASQPTLRLSAAPSQVQAGEAVTFTVEVPVAVQRELARADRGRDDVGQPPAVEFVFEFGDRASQRVPDRRARHEYARPGRYTAVVWMMRGDTRLGVSNEVTVRVERSAPPPWRPTVDLVADRTRVRVGESVTLTARVSPPADGRGEVSYRFVYGDGGQAISRTPQVTRRYGRQGQFDAGVEVRLNGEDVARSRRVTVTVAPPEVRPSVRLIASPREITEGDRVTFTAIVRPTAGVGEYEYVFDIGEGGPRRISGAQTAHVYERAGPYQASVQLLRRGELVARSAPQTLRVSPRVVAPDPEPVDTRPADPEPQPDPEIPDSETTEPEQVDPEAVGQDLTDTEAEPLNVTLVADPEAALVGQEVAFTARGVGGGEVTYAFVFNDRPEAEASSAPTLTRRFPEAGDVEASVQVLRDGNVVGESAPIRVSITVPPPGAVTLHAGPESPRAGAAVTFTTRGAPPDTTVEYRFDFGDGEVSAWGREGQVEHVYAASGTYDARVEVRGVPGAPGTVASPVVAVTVGEASASIPLWALVLLGALVVLGAYLWRRTRAPAPLPAPLIGLKARPGEGAARLATDRPPSIDWEIRVRPVPDAGRHHIVTHETTEP